MTEEEEIFWERCELTDMEIGHNAVKPTLHFYFKSGRVSIYQLGEGTGNGWNFAVYDNEGKFVTGRKFMQMLNIISDKRDTSLKSILNSNNFASRNAGKILAQMAMKMSEYEKELIGVVVGEDNIPFFKNVKNPSWFNIMTGWRKILYIEDDAHFVVGGATFLGSKIIDDEPMWCRIIGVPSSSKSVSVKAMTPGNRVNKYVHPLSDLTTKSMISGLEGNIDLYPLLDKKLLTMEEFTIIITKEHKELTAIVGQLLAMYGGHYNKTFGSGVGTKSYDAVFGMLVACTPLIDIIAHEFSIMGERFYSIRIKHNIKSRIHEKIADVAWENKIADPSYVESIQDEMFSLYEKFDPENMPIVPDNMALYIKNCAHITAFLRVSVNRDSFSQDITTEPSIEISGRLVKVYHKLARIIAWMLEKSEVDTEVLSYIYRVAMDTPVANRITALRTMKFMDHAQELDQICEKMRLPKNTVKKILEELQIADIVTTVQLTTTLDNGEKKYDTGYHLNNDSLLFEYIQSVELELGKLTGDKIHHYNMSVTGLDMWKDMTNTTGVDMTTLTIDDKVNEQNQGIDPEEEKMDDMVNARIDEDEIEGQPDTSHLDTDHGNGTEELKPMGVK